MSPPSPRRLARSLTYWEEDIVWVASPFQAIVQLPFFVVWRNAIVK